MNCCGGGEHKHSENMRKDNQGHSKSSLNWVQIGVLLLVVLVVVTLLVFVK